MTDCKRCYWLKRIFCIFACPAVQDEHDRCDEWFLGEKKKDTK